MFRERSSDALLLMLDADDLRYVAGGDTLVKTLALGNFDDMIGVNV